MLITGKYDVFHNDPPNPSQRIPEDSFFVLRAGDALATMTLRSYVANAFQLLDWDVDPTTGLTLLKDQSEHLSDLADGVTILANNWAKRPHKIPD